MRRQFLSVVATIALAAAISLASALTDSRPLVDWFFVTAVLSAVLLVVRASVRAVRGAVRARHAAARLDAIEAGEVARRAVIEEHRRLSRDIEVSVRDSLGIIARTAAAAADDPDPRPRMAAIRAEATRATTDLRRQLGLLRADGQLSRTESAIRANSPESLRRGDWLLTVVLVGLATAELAVSVLLPPDERPTRFWGSAAVTVCIAATVLWRRLAPEAASLACAGILLTGSLSGRPPLTAFSVTLALGVLGWACAALGTWRGWGVLFLLGGCALASQLLDHPENAPILMIMYAVGVMGGATVGRSRRRHDRARARADAREDELRAAAAEAVGAERRMMARELHDVVSHAVSVIAIQAGAAEVSWLTHQATARRAIDVIVATADQTAAELDHLMPGQVSIRHELADLRALIDRMRVAGLEAELEVVNEPPSPLPGTIYRVVQEALTNALRYAPGSKVRVRIDRTDDEITIRVSDDGPGPAADSRRGYGLIGLAERLRLAGGSLTTRSAPGVRGFELTAVLPAAAVVTP